MIAQAIGYDAIKQGFVVRYRSIFDLVAEFQSEEVLAQRDRLLRGYLEPDPHIIDDMGLKHLPKHAGKSLLGVMTGVTSLPLITPITNILEKDWALRHWRHHGRCSAAFTGVVDK